MCWHSVTTCSLGQFFKVTATLPFSVSIRALVMRQSVLQPPSNDQLAIRPASPWHFAEHPNMRGQAACPHSVSNFSEALVERWSPRWCGQAAPNLGVALGACACKRGALACTGLDLQLKVDFDRQVLAGECQLTVRSLPVDHVILDVLDLATRLQVAIFESST